MILQQSTPLTTEYGTAELRALAKRLTTLRCPECDSTEQTPPDAEDGRTTCPKCSTCFRPEDVVTIALLKAYQCGVEDRPSQASNTSPEDSVSATT